MKKVKLLLIVNIISLALIPAPIINRLLTFLLTFTSLLKLFLFKISLKASLYIIIIPETATPDKTLIL